MSALTINYQENSQTTGWLEPPGTGNPLKVRKTFGGQGEGNCIVAGMGEGGTWG